VEVLVEQLARMVRNLQQTTGQIALLCLVVVAAVAMVMTFMATLTVNPAHRGVCVLSSVQTSTHPVLLKTQMRQALQQPALALGQFHQE
jgi:hypothetical protein